MAKRETQADFERVKVTEIASAQSRFSAAVMDDPNRTDESVKAAFIAFHLDIRRLVNDYLGLNDDTPEMAKLMRDKLDKSWRSGAGRSIT
jgi:hypothetical protein